MKKFILLNLVILGISAILAGPARAQFFLEQGKINLNVSGGDRINKSLTIHNTTQEEQVVKAYWEDFEYQPPYEGAKKFLPVGTGVGTSAAGWVNFSPQEFTLPPQGKKEIEYSINVPQKYDAGHYGILFFERASEPYKDATGVNIITRVGALFFIEPKNIEKKAELKNLKQDVASLTGEFHNMSTVILIPQITYYVMNNDGLVADRGELKKLYIPPSVAAKWTIPLSFKLEPGEYSMVINADFEEGNVAVKEVKLTKDSSGNLTVDVPQD
ncbi:MAG: hypothetical protein V2A70_05310 [Candidatus Omnitrophota bacterium]